jgi:hypothetical protein
MNPTRGDLFPVRAKKTGERGGFSFHGKRLSDPPKGLDGPILIYFAPGEIIFLGIISQAAHPIE